MTRASTFLNSLSEAIRNARGGDITGIRLANLSLGEILEYSERHGIAFSLGGSSDIKSLSDEELMAEVSRRFGKRGEHVRLDIIDVTEQLFGGCCSPPPTGPSPEDVKDAFNSPQVKQVMKELETLITHPAFAGRTKAVLANPKAKAYVKSLVDQYEMFRAMGAPELPFMDVLKRSVA